MASQGKFHLFLTTAILTLAACGGSETKTTDNNIETATANDASVPASEVTDPAQAAAASPTGALTADYMVGKWSAMDEDCSDILEFRKDGTVSTPIADAKWTLTGDQLAIDYGEGSTQKPTTIKPLGPDRIEITTSSGRKETQKRC